MEINVNSFNEGMDKDSSKQAYPSNRYYDMQNFDVLADQDGANVGGRVNKLGNRKLVDLGYNIANLTFNIVSGPTVTAVILTINGADINVGNINLNTATTQRDRAEATQALLEAHGLYGNIFKSKVFNDEVNIYALTNPIQSVRLEAASVDVTSTYATTALTEMIIIGLESLRNTCIIFTTDKNEVSNNDQVWRTTYDDNSLVDIELIYNGDLNFSINYPIRAIAYYENSDVEKCYWTDANNPLRYINLNSTALPYTEPTQLNIFPAVNFDTPILESTNTGGRFLSGAVQYAYQLYTINGNETSLSPLSDMYHISKNKDKGTGPNEECEVTFNLRVDNLDDRFTHVKIYRIHTTAKDVTPEVTLIVDNEFNELDGNSSGSIWFSDNGIINLGTFSDDLINLLTPNNFVPEDINSKDNILFAANVKDDFFDISHEDFDARAYNFNRRKFSQGDADRREVQLYDREGTLLTVEIPAGQQGFGSTAWDAIPENHDCINPNFWDSVNNIESKGGVSSNSANANTYDVQYLSQTRGGQGKNVKYSFITPNDLYGEHFVTDSYNGGTAREDVSSINDVQGSNDIFAKGNKSFRNPALFDLKGYKRGEIYRFGIQFINDYGKKSFVKWVADIQIPDTSDAIEYVKYDAVSDDVSVYPLYLQFEVNIPQVLIDDYNVKSFQIVRVERVNADKTIITQGSLGLTIVENITDKLLNIEPTYNTANFNTSWVPNAANIIKRGDILSFQSPEASIGREKLDGEYELIIDGFLNVQAYWSGTNVDIHKLYDFHKANPNIDASGNVVDDAILKIKRVELVESYYDSNDAADNGIKFDNDYTFRNMLRFNVDHHGGGNGDQLGGTGGTRYVLQTEKSNADLITSTYFNHFDSYSYSQGGWVPVGSLRRKLSAQYGGLTYEARSANTYIECGKPVAVTTAQTYTSNIQRGDTYIGYYETYHKMMFDSNQNQTGGAGTYYNLAIGLYPLETSINIDLLHADTFFKDNNISQIRELAAQTQQALTIAGLSNIQDISDVFDYNTVYSEQNVHAFNIPKPFKINDNPRNDVKIRWSAVKSPGELIDNWTNFSLNNEYQVDGQYGPINALLNLNDQLYFLQDEGFGLLIVNPRLQTRDQSGLDYILGRGDTVYDHQYYSTTNGCQSKWACAVGQYSLIFYDYFSGRLMSFNGRANELSLLNGMDSYFISYGKNFDKYNNRQFGYNPLLDSGISMSWNNQNKEFYITTAYRYDEEVPAIPEPITQTVKVKDSVVFNELYGKFIERVSFTPGLYNVNQNKFFTTNPDLNQLWLHDSLDRCKYYGTYYDSTVTLLINPKGPVNCIYDLIEFVSENYDFSNNNTDSTFDRIRVRNDYQDSGILPISPKRRFRTYRLDVPRNTDNARMRDNHLFVTLYKSNDNGIPQEGSPLPNHKFITHNIHTKYRVAQF